MGLSPSAFEKATSKQCLYQPLYSCQVKVLFCLVPPALCVVVTLSKAEAPKDYN
jgi:hypothetical protein